MPDGRHTLLAPATLAFGLVLAACGPAPADAPRSFATPAAPGSAEPHLAAAANGDLVLSWLEPDGDGVALRYARLASDDSEIPRWSTPRTLARGDDWFVNWADFPSVVPVDGDLWAAHWLVRRPGGRFAYDVTVALSQDGGDSWGEPFVPHRDGTATEHGFVSLFPWQDGVGALWLDGRETAHRGTGDHATGGAMTLRAAVLGSRAGPATLVDDRVCDCCQTDVAIAAGVPIAVYRNRTAGEVRDIHVSRFRTGVWSESRPVATDGWRIDGCPVNGPAIAAADDRVAVAWFTGADDRPRVRLALSKDGGDSFDAAVDLDAADPVGRVDVELLPAGGAVVSWIGRDASGNGVLRLRRVDTDGVAGPVQAIATLDTHRQTGFPQLARQTASLVLAWTDTGAAPSELRMVRVPLQR